jgi:hypothetical protein
MSAQLKLVSPRSDDMTKVTEAYLGAASPARIPTELIQQARREVGCCNGNCKQNRPCDCVPDYPEPEREPMTAFDQAVMRFIFIAFMAWVAGIVWLLLSLRA